MTDNDEIREWMTAADNEPRCRYCGKQHEMETGYCPLPAASDEPREVPTWTEAQAKAWTDLHALLTIENAPILADVLAEVAQLQSNDDTPSKGVRDGTIGVHIYYAAANIVEALRLKEGR